MARCHELLAFLAARQTHLKHTSIMKVLTLLFARFLLALAIALLAVASHAAVSDDDKARTVIHLLDYIGVDYPETVKEGKVQDAGEYQEQREFAAQVLALLSQMPDIAERDALLAQTRFLIEHIDAKAPGGDVSGLTRSLGGEVIQRYQVAVAPRQAPDLTRAANLFQAQCAACHGSQGRGDGPAARGMDPAPSNFLDATRMNKRSAFGLYNTITLGVKGTAMQPFTALSDADRWALSFLVSGMRNSDAERALGESQWRNGLGKAEMGDLRRLVTITPQELRSAAPDLDSVRAYLLANPASVAAAGPAPLALARSKLDAALAAYRGGDQAGARQLAITAYLEGFELVEASLDNVDPSLRRKTEEAMMALRSDIDGAKPFDAFAQRVQSVKALLDEVDRKLAAGEMSFATAFTSSLLILLREGLEAILVLAAILAFVRKTGRRDALPYIHAGWIAAVVLGILTWIVASHFLAVSGASREFTEGFSALFAAAMLLYVGLWLHNRSQAQAWQTFIRDQVSGALAKRTLWAMSGISFLAVYRELFEVILFYETLLAQAGDAGQGAVVAGIGVGAAMLGILGALILRYAARLPIGPFFSATSWLLVVMAVIFVGHGVSALQEAGVLRSTPVDFIALPMLGVHPNVQGLLAQSAMLAVTVIVLLAGRRGTRV